MKVNRYCINHCFSLIIFKKNKKMFKFKKIYLIMTKTTNADDKNCETKVIVRKQVIIRIHNCHSINSN